MITKLSKLLKIFSKSTILGLLIVTCMPKFAFASEADLEIPKLSSWQNNFLYVGIFVCILGMLFGLYQFLKVKKIKAHSSMLDVANTIYETCKTYLIQQGKFLAILLFLRFAPVKGDRRSDSDTLLDSNRYSGLL